MCIEPMKQPACSIRNQYLGINAHLHSYWQSMGGWAGFHTNHISDLLRLMRAQLLPMGYTAEIEDSLQIRREDDRVERPKSDVSIYDLDPLRSGFAASLSSAKSGALGFSPIAEKPYWAAAIYRIEAGITKPHDPTAWLELLSPSNKPGGQDHEAYQQKRIKLLRRGIVFVELHYLHEMPPTVESLAHYRRHSKSGAIEDEAHPYRILVFDPRPDLPDGKVYVHEFDVDVPIPVVTIPLNVEDLLEFDFGAAYKKTLEETLYTLERVDYRAFPIHFDRYQSADQHRIALRMLSVLEAAQKGQDIEKGTFPLTEMAFEDALNTLEVLNN